MFGLGALDAFLLMVPLFIAAVAVVLVLMLAWRVWRLSSDIRVIREAVEFMADSMEDRRRNPVGLEGRSDVPGADRPRWRVQGLGPDRQGTGGAA